MAKMDYGDNQEHGLSEVECREDWTAESPPSLESTVPPRPTKQDIDTPLPQMGNVPITEMNDLKANPNQDESLVI